MPANPPPPPDYSTMSTTVKTPVVRTDVVRVVCLVVPKAGITLEEFDEYWLNTHGPLFAAVPIAQQILIKYEQVQSSPFPLNSIPL